MEILPLRRSVIENIVKMTRGELRQCAKTGKIFGKGQIGTDIVKAMQYIAAAARAANTKHSICTKNGFVVQNASFGHTNILQTHGNILSDIR